jgi:peroxiredoxin
MSLLQEEMEDIDDENGDSCIGVSIIGISDDKPERHAKFRTKHELPYVLLTDFNVSHTTFICFHFVSG